MAETRNSRYRIFVLDTDGNVVVQGGRYFQQPTTARVEGCTHGGSLLDSGWIAIDAGLAVSVRGKRVVTSPVQSIAVKVSAAAA